MGFIIYTKSGQQLLEIPKVLSCDINETLAGVKTLSFETILTDEILTKVTDTNLVVEYATDYYDVISLDKSLSRGIYKIKFSCEHVSYRLNNYSKAATLYTGTARELLSNLLAKTEFSVGIVDTQKAITFNEPEDATIRNLVLKLADQLNVDAVFEYYSVSLYTHRGRNKPIEVIDNNVVSISKSLKSNKDKPTYSITLRDSVNLTVGDELHLKFTKLGIDENLRLIGIKRKPFTSKDVSIEVGESEATLEADIVKIEEDVVSKNKSYYGVKISNEKGLTIDRNDNTGKVILNADEFRMQALNKDGRLEDKLYFDPESGSYKFKGSVDISGGYININNNFIVDENGNAYLSGDATIYGGKYYAGEIGGKDGYSQMTPGGFEVYNADADLKLKLGYTTEEEDFPFLQLGSGQGENKDFGLVKKFSDGLWIGNSQPEDESGEFVAKVGYNGIFFKFSDNTAYVVKDAEMKNIYTGAAIAKFG